MLYSTMEKGEGAVAMDVECFSKLGTEQLQQGYMQRALEAFTNAYKSSQALGNHGYMQRACAFNLGALLLSMGRFNDGVHYLSLAKPNEGCKDGKSNGDLYFNFGLAYEGLKDNAESRRYFERALGEYRSERSNIKMEADTTRRIGHLCVNSGQFAEAEVWIKQLIQAYESLGDKESRLQAEAERAHLLLKMGRVEEAEEIADDCLKSAKAMVSARIENVFNELGLVYTQMTKYEKALDSDQHALTLLKASESDAKLLAVLYQNMGALYNYMGQFQEAIEYHKIAIKKHAELKARKSQGHCFLNLGYAYSQLKELEKAGESFLHAAQAAKDCGDKKSEWQSLEAMGSVAYNQGDLRKAQEYYKQSLATVGVSEDTADKDVQDRILTKLTQIIHSQAQKSLVSVRQRTLAASKTPTEETAVKQTTSDYTSLEEQPASMRPSDIRPSDILEGKDQKVIKVKRGSKIKHIKIRRSGTLRQFKKFALGLDVSRPSTAEQRMLPSKDAVSILSAETISEHDMDEMESTGSDDDSDTENQNRQAKQNVQSPDGIEADEASENDESGDDERKVHAEMQKYASEEMPGTSGFVRQIFSADVHAKAQDDASDSEDGDNSDETSSDDSDDDDDDGKSEPQKKALAPPVPPMSPPVTAEPANVRTYEKPTQREPLYETIDHLRKSRGTSGGERRVSDGDGLNFFHSDEWGDKQKKNSKGESKAEENNRASLTFDRTVYENMRPASRQGRRPPGSGIEIDAGSEGSDENLTQGAFPILSKGQGQQKSNNVQDSGKINEEEEEQGNLQDMSRAERDVFMFSEFKKDATNRDKPVTSTTADARKGSQKNSKHCIVM